MKQKPVLVIMAAGIGSRYGAGVKQLAKVGPSGEIIMDYSLYDAREAGFEKVWLVGEEFVKTPCPGNFVLFNNVDEVKQVLAAEKPKGMTVLVKGSNSTRMFELPAYL